MSSTVLRLIAVVHRIAPLFAGRFRGISLPAVGSAAIARDRGRRSPLEAVVLRCSRKAEPDMEARYDAQMAVPGGLAAFGASDGRSADGFRGDRYGAAIGLS
jgi:hypothetical protein